VTGRFHGTAHAVFLNIKTSFGCPPMVTIPAPNIESALHRENALTLIGLRWVRRGSTAASSPRIYAGPPAFLDILFAFGYAVEVVTDADDFRHSPRRPSTF